MVDSVDSTPKLRSVVLDTLDARRLAEFYRQLLGFEYRDGDEPPEPGRDDPKGVDWLVLRAPGGSMHLAFQQVDELPVSSWPEASVPQQLHLDLAVKGADELTAARRRAEELGATVLRDRFDDPIEPLYVFADLAGHPFCIFVEAAG